jgi:O-acetyl-ADP-ribose deacetylase (regulator of RNase III)
MNGRREQEIISRSGSIFTSSFQTVVNTVNCAGIMGAGIALEFRRRYPQMFREYEKLCDERKIRIGKLWLHKTPGRWILNFPTKQHWRDPSREADIAAGLEEFKRRYVEWGIESIAFPLLGAMHGGIPSDRSRALMKQHLSTCELFAEIWSYDPQTTDDLLPLLASQLRLAGDAHLRGSIGVSAKSLAMIRAAIESGDIHQLSQVEQLPGIGQRAIEKLYAHTMALSEGGPAIDTQLTLFDAL